MWEIYRVGLTSIQNSQCFLINTTKKLLLNGFTKTAYSSSYTKLATINLDFPSSSTNHVQSCIHYACSEITQLYCFKTVGGFLKLLQKVATRQLVHQRSLDCNSMRIHLILSHNLGIFEEFNLRVRQRLMLFSIVFC